MQIVADRLSLRWYLGYDLTEPLPDHSSLSRIRERSGLDVCRCFFEAVVERVSLQDVSGVRSSTSMRPRSRPTRPSRHSNHGLRPRRIWRTSSLPWETTETMAKASESRTGKTGVVRRSSYRSTSRRRHRPNWLNVLRSATMGSGRPVAPIGGQRAARTGGRQTSASVRPFPTPRRCRRGYHQQKQELAAAAYLHLRRQLGAPTLEIRQRPAAACCPGSTHTASRRARHREREGRALPQS